MPALSQGGQPGRLAVARAQAAGLSHRFTKPAGAGRRSWLRPSSTWWSGKLRPRGAACGARRRAGGPDRSPLPRARPGQPRAGGGALT